MELMSWELRMRISLGFVMIDCDVDFIANMWFGKPTMVLDMFLVMNLMLVVEI